MKEYRVTKVWLLRAEDEDAALDWVATTDPQPVRQEIVELRNV